MIPDVVFAIDGTEARPSEPVSLNDAGMHAPGAYTDWIVQHPQLLGPRVRVIATDLRWDDERTSDPGIDVLGLDEDGRLVIGVILVDGAPEQALLRALTQAANASRLAPETLAGIHAAHLRQQGQHVADDVALHRLVVHTGRTIDPDRLARPRMVLFTEALSPALSTTMIWLDEMGIDIALQRLHAYQLGDQWLVIVSRVFPPEHVTDFDVVRPRHLRAVPRFRGEAEVDVTDGPAFDLPPRRTARGIEPDSDIVYTNGFGHPTHHDE
jgi:hypothetical protein